MEDLVFLVGVDPLLLEDPVLGFQIKERPGADADDQGLFQIIGHGCSLLWLLFYIIAWLRSVCKEKGPGNSRAVGVYSQ